MRLPSTRRTSRPLLPAAKHAMSREDLGYRYSDWLRWACTGDLEKFYENARWPGWDKEVAAP
jgi:Protein of unknown function DUF2625